MSLFRELFDVAAPEPDTGVERPPLPDGQIRVHVFSGNFDDEEALLSYCFDAPDEDAPEPLNRDLDGAFVDTAYVATGFASGISRALAEIFPQREVDHILPKVGKDNSVVIISEYAFGDLPYILGDTPQLEYLGEWITTTR